MCKMCTQPIRLFQGFLSYRVVFVFCHQSLLLLSYNYFFASIIWNRYCYGTTLAATYLVLILLILCINALFKILATFADHL